MLWQLHCTTNKDKFERFMIFEQTVITSLFPEITRNALENIIRYSSIVAGTFYYYYLRENKKSHIKEKTRIKQLSVKCLVSRIFSI